MISKFEQTGVFELVTNLQKAAMMRILNPKGLNRMLSTQTTIRGNPLSVEKLIHQLVNQILIERERPDIFERTLQKNMLHHLMDLADNDAVQPELKGLIDVQLKALEKSFKSKRSKGTEILKKHHRYCYELLHNR